MTLTQENLKSFLDRDWDLMRRSKDRSLAQSTKQRGTQSALHLAQGLRAATSFVYPTQQERIADRAMHLMLKEKLERASSRRFKIARRTRSGVRTP